MGIMLSRGRVVVLTNRKSKNGRENTFENCVPHYWSIAVVYNLHCN
jgi:hypothetical protein